MGLLVAQSTEKVLQQEIEQAGTNMENGFGAGRAGELTCRMAEQAWICCGKNPTRARPNARKACWKESKCEPFGETC